MAVRKYIQAYIHSYYTRDLIEYGNNYEYFDLVFEAFTIQSLPVEFREKMVTAVVNSVAVDGKFLLVAHKREEDFEGPPWPLTLDEVALFNRAGLIELSHAIHTEESKISNTRFRVLYTKIA